MKIKPKSQKRMAKKVTDIKIGFKAYSRQGN